MNTHLLIHITESVRHLGPLWSQTTFSFETNNSTLVKSVKGSHNVIRQIAGTYVQRKSVQFRADAADMDVERTHRVLGKGNLKKIDERMKVALMNKTFSDNLLVYSRIEYRNVIYTSTEYKKIKSVDYFVQFNDGSVGMVLFYFILGEIVHVLFEKFEICAEDNSNHIQKIKPSSTLEVRNIADIKKKLLYIEIKCALCQIKQYISYVPNHYEKS